MDAAGAARLARGGAPETRTAIRGVVANAGWLLLAYIIPRAFTLLSVVVAARVLGVSEFGAYGTAAAFAVVLSIVSTAGMMPLLVRELARRPERAAGLLRAAHRVKAVSGIVMLVALLALARALGYSPSVTAAALVLGLGYAIGSFAENLGAYYQAIERMRVWTQANALFGIVSGVLGAALVVGTGSVVWFCAAFAAGWATALAWLFHRLPRSIRSPAAVHAGDIAALVRGLAPFAAAFVALTVYYKLDVLLLARWQSAEQVGLYAAAYKFFDIAQALAVVAATAVYPRLSRAAASAGPRAGAGLAELTLAAAALPAAALWLARSDLIHVLYGGGYAESAAVLGALAPALPVLCANIVAGFVLNAAGRTGRLAVLYGVAIGANFVLNAAWIPAYGAVGAAWAKLATEAALAVGLLIALRLSEREQLG